MRRPHLAWLAAALAAVVCTAAADPLPAFDVDRSQTTVSGLSSGAFMAVQFHTAFSAEIAGAGVVAGGPYNCAWVNLGGIDACMRGEPSGSVSVAAAWGFAAWGAIDGPDNLRRSRVYLFSGTEDAVVSRTVVDATYRYYRDVGVPESNIQYVGDVPAGHAFIAPSRGGDCGDNESPYINRCAVHGGYYDQAGAILAHLHGPLNAPSHTQAGRVVAFDQRPFSEFGMADEGFLYVPQTCEQGATCSIHVVFHGCRQTPEDIGDRYYTETGYNRWADTNNILVLYPQVAAGLATNPEHCWDWWGYTGLQFNVKAGPQMRAVKAMVDRLGR